MARQKPNSDWIGRTLGNRYKIEEFIDQGGMSVVYKASDPNLRRTVAIKIIHQHLSNNPQFVRRFEQEAAAVAMLRHPNIIQVYDFNHDDRTYYMVMEYVPGQTLKDKLKSLSTANQHLPLKDVISIMTTICEAVAYAHERGMIHRDLKPANVMLTPRGQVILMDFGVAKMLSGQDETMTGTIIGTAKYMSPEQARGERPDARSDIYALGVILYEMVAGQPPFDADTTVPILLKHVNEPVPNIRDIQKDVPENLIEIIEKSLAKNPEERYQMAAHMAIALKLLSRMDKTLAPAVDSQRTVMSGSKQPSPASDPASTIYKPVAAPATKVLEPVPGKKSSSTRFWLAGIAAAGLLFMVLAVALLAFVFTRLSSEIYATGQPAEANLPSAEGMARISAGDYSVGLNTPDQDHAPIQTTTLPEYWIDQWEVTNAQYARFLSDTDQSPPSTWKGGSFPADQDNFPVMGITWEQAAAYCEWAKKRLPTEAEWEVAARGAEDRLFPWGDNQQAVSLPRSGTYQVGTKMTNQSPFGVFDMAGNVWEWVDEPYAPVPAGERVLRGGTNDFLKDMAYRLIGDPAVPTMSASAGVRCAADEVIIDEHHHNTLAENVYYEDSFTDPGSGWPILSEGVFYYGYHPPDFYHVEVATADNRTAVTHPPNFDNVTVISDVLVDHTNTENGNFRYGLVLRRQAPDQFYAFTVSPRSREWVILKSSSAGLEVLQQGEITTLKGIAPHGVTPDQTDELRVDASGANFVFQINGQAVSQISDAAYANGEVGFYVETFDETLTHIHYDKLTVEKVDTVADASILYDDEFTDPNSGWSARDNEGEPFRYGYHPPDFYHVEPRAAHTAVEVAIPQSQSFTNATVETAVLVDHTADETGIFRYGLMLRRSAQDKFYAFAVSPRQKLWQVLKSSPAGIETLAEGPIASLQGVAPPGVTPASTDKLRVDAVDSTFVFQINGQPVIKVTDADYATGEVGFFAENLDETVSHIHYESLTVKKVDPDKLVQAPSPK